jgi:uncharacterized protein (DUF58 family)
VTARRGRPHTKLYREERERPVLLLVDLGHNMFFGSRRLKSAQAMRAAALLAWSTERAANRIGGVIVAGDQHRTRPALPRREAVLVLLRVLVALQPRAPGPLAPGAFEDGLARVAHTAHPGSLIPVLSDFHFLSDGAERSLKRMAQHNDVLLIQVFDALEAEPPPPGRYRLGVPGQLIDLDSAAAAGRWRQQFVERRGRLERLARRLGAPLIALSTDANPLAVLARGVIRHGRAA